MYDFGGWATKYNIACSDGRTIKHGAFEHQDSTVIPLVWNHTYDSPENVIGKATLMHKDEGVYAMCEFNDTPTAETAKSLVKHGDVTSLSIFANKLMQKGNDVIHGQIRELSLVLAGANPGAYIEEVLMHSTDDTLAAKIYSEESELDLVIPDDLSHSDDKPDEGDKDNEPKPEDDSKETVADVYDTLSDKQKKAVAIIIDELTTEGQNDDNEEDDDMKHNVFDKDKNKGAELIHSLDFGAIVKEAKKPGSTFKEAFLAHAEEKIGKDALQHAGNYGINEIETLFPDAHLMNNEPGFIERDKTWVSAFLAGTKKTPFSRIKVINADITGDSARALGYVKGNLKKEEVFSLLKRTTEPTTIYKKQKLDRDDIVDITSFDVVVWLKREMRGMLDEELARAILVGDGRLANSEDKIKEDYIRPIYNDSDLYTIKHEVPDAGFDAKKFIRACIKSRVEYEGVGMPNLYTTEEMIAEMLLIEDTNGRFIYESEAALARVLRVKEIIPVPVMKNLVRSTTDSKVHHVEAVIVNPNDYTVGADKGGQVAMFDDFDIDYNQQKYLIETRCSGSLTKPKTAITIERVK